MSSNPRIGVFGGTFDPIHKVHLAIAEAALAHASLDKVLFVVSARPPHKRGEYVAEAEDRFAMAQAAVADEPRMEASRIELDREGPSYTVDTLDELAGLYPGAELFLIVGADSLSDLPGWKDFDAIMGRAKVLCVSRPGDWEAPRELEGRFEMLPFEEDPESSTHIRARLANGEPAEGAVPEAAEAIILDKGLYRGGV